GGFQDPDPANEEDGRPVHAAGQTAGTVLPGGGTDTISGRQGAGPDRGHHQFDDPSRAGAPGDHQGFAQAPHCGRRRRAGAGGEPTAEAVRADAEGDEADAKGRHAENDALYEGLDAWSALRTVRPAGSLRTVKNLAERG